MIGFITKLMSLTQQTDGKCNDENCQQNLCLHKEVMILFYTLLGFWLLLKGNILEKLPAQITHAGDWEILEGIK